MALKTSLPSIYDAEELQFALQTVEFELSFEKSKHIVATVTKNEDIRKLRLQLLLLEDENEGLHSQLLDEQNRGDALETDVDEAQIRADELDAEVVRTAMELKLKAKELDTMKTEILALENVSSDSTKILSEKLSLARELSALKPEVEHLRSQASGQENLLAEKLQLQRQVSTLEVELENEKRAMKRAQTKSGKNNAEQQDADEEHEAELDDLRRKLKEEKVLHKEAKKESERLKQELESEKRLSATAKSDKDAACADSQQLGVLKKELAKEKRDREAAERGVQKVQSEAEAKTSMLNEKLSAFRTKLKSTKDKLKETEAKLQKTQENGPSAATEGANNPRKRAADADATIGTPGDAQQAKRGRRAQPAVGEKSSFSITPFLNRTSSVAPGSPIPEEDEDEDEEAATPSVAKPKGNAASSGKAKPLAPASSAKANSKTGPRAKKSALEVVEEETSAFKEDSPKPPTPQPVKPAKADATASTTTTTKLKLGAPVPRLKPVNAKDKPRKSLLEFEAFNKEPEPEKKKKRKLLGQGFGKTLFDEEEDEVEKAVKPIPGRGMFAGRALASMKGKSSGNAALITAPDGFQFSPLKKQRRAGGVRADQSRLGL